MTNRLIILFFLLLHSSFVLFAQKAEIFSAKGKHVVINYSVDRRDTEADIVFKKCSVNDDNELVLLFSTSRACDRIKKRSTLKLDSIIESTPYKIEQLNKEPLHIICNGSSIRISQLNKDEDYQIHFPIYLAKSDRKKEKYDLIDLCHLRIDIPPVDINVEKPKSTSGTERENHPQNENLQVNDIDDHDDLIEDADWNERQAEIIENNEKTIQIVKKHLSEAQDLLNHRESSIKLFYDMDGTLKSDIDKIEEIDPSHSLRDSIKSIKGSIEKIIEEQEQAVRDSIAATAKQEAEAAQQRNMWMIIGGIILAILGFVGNQAFQHYRNVRNEKNMMSMQQSIVRRAEDEAKRRAQSMARQKVNQVQNAARRKSQDYVRGSINSGISKISKGKKNKGISI